VQSPGLDGLADEGFLVRGQVDFYRVHRVTVWAADPDVKPADHRHSSS